MQRSCVDKLCRNWTRIVFECFRYVVFALNYLIVGYALHNVAHLPGNGLF